jgi:hypothetical protein
MTGPNVAESANPRTCGLAGIRTATPAHTERFRERAGIVAASVSIFTAVAVTVSSPGGRTHEMNECNKRRIGRIKVAYELLADWLEFPRGSRILQILPTDQPFTFAVVVEHPDLPEVPIGAALPDVEYTLTRVEGTFTRRGDV